MREDVGGSLKDLNDSMLKGMTGMADSQQKQMDLFSRQLIGLTESNQKKLDELKVAVQDKLQSIQQDNNKQLDQMRATVDEKLQGTLERGSASRSSKSVNGWSKSTKGLARCSFLPPVWET